MRQQHYPEMIRFRAPQNFSALIAEAASENFQNISDYMRQLVLSEMRLSGRADLIGSHRRAGASHVHAHAREGKPLAAPPSISPAPLSA